MRYESAFLTEFLEGAAHIVQTLPEVEVGADRVCAVLFFGRPALKSFDIRSEAVEFGPGRKVPVGLVQIAQKQRRPFHKGVEAFGPLMCGTIGRKEHTQFPNGIDPTGTTQLAHKRFCCQNVRVDEGLVRTPDKRMAQVQSCTLAGQNDQMAFPLIFRRFSDPVG